MNCCQRRISSNTSALPHSNEMTRTLQVSGVPCIANAAELLRLCDLEHATHHAAACQAGTVMFAQRLLEHVLPSHMQCAPALCLCGERDILQV